jgi:hypothetical protein
MSFGLMESTMQIELKNYHTEQGVSTVLVGPVARTRMPIVIIEHKGVMLRQVPATEQRYMSEPPKFRRKKTMKTIARQYLAIGSKLGIGKPAKRFLRQIINAD